MPGGSTGKTFAALLTLRLAEAGVLSLDDPASKWLGDRPWFRKLPNAETMRIRHLLSHSSGLRDYPGTLAFNSGMLWRVLRHGSAYFTPEELIDIADRGRPLFDAGAGYRYTDAGYLVLGRALEAAAGASYYDLLRQHVLDPLGLDGIRPQTETAPRNIATGYMGGGRGRNLKKDGRMKLDPRTEWTGGGLITTPTQLVAFFGAVHKHWPHHLAQMAAGGWRDPTAPDWHYGYGIFVDHDAGTLNHGGLWPGYRTRVTHVPETGLTIAVQTNRDGRVDLRGLVGRISAQLRLAGSSN